MHHLDFGIGEQIAHVFFGSWVSCGFTVGVCMCVCIVGGCEFACKDNRCGFPEFCVGVGMVCVCSYICDVRMCLCYKNGHDL